MSKKTFCDRCDKEITGYDPEAPRVGEIIQEGIPHHFDDICTECSILFYDTVKRFFELKNAEIQFVLPEPKSGGGE